MLFSLWLYLSMLWNYIRPTYGLIISVHIMDFFNLMCGWTCPLFGLQFDYPLGWTCSLVDFIMYPSTCGPNYTHPHGMDPFTKVLVGSIIPTHLYGMDPSTCGPCIHPAMDLTMYPSSCGLILTLMGWTCPLMYLLISKHPCRMNKSTCGLDNFKAFS